MAGRETLNFDFELMSQTEADQTCLFTKSIFTQETTPHPGNTLSCSIPHHAHFKSP